MRRSARPLVSAGILMLAACAAKPEPEVRIKTAPVAVGVGCVLDRPADVVPIKDRVSQDEWMARAPGAKAAAVEGQAYERMNYADKLDAATKGCKAAP